MGWGKAERIELAADAAAAVALAGAAAFALFELSADRALAAALAALSCVSCFYALRRLEPAAVRLPISPFAPRAFTPEPIEELLLTDADRLAPEERGELGELLLDRAVAHVGPGSRVVRLFEPAAMPTPSELKARIDRHLGGTPPAAHPDASDALFEALTELRRSLR